MIQPTLGLGAVRPRPRSDSATAAAIQRASSAGIVMERRSLDTTHLGEAAIGGLTLGHRLLLLDSLDLLLRDDLGVGAVGGPVLHVDDALGYREFRIMVEARDEQHADADRQRREDILVALAR